MHKTTTFLALLLPALHLAGGTDEPLDIGTHRELFVDQFLVDRLAGKAEFRLHHPTPQGVALVADQRWEGNGGNYMTVFRDGDRCRMYYRGVHVVYRPGGYSEPHPEYTCYAESPDGITWTRPNLGLFEVLGTRSNNVVLTRELGGNATHNFSPFLDARFEVPPAERYKALGGGSEGLTAFGSADGLRWRKLQAEPVITKGAFDSQNLAFWDAERGEYRAYFRDFREGRDIKTCTSKDFLHWTEAKFLDYVPNRISELYCNQINPYPRAPHLLLGFPTRYLDRGWTEAARNLPQLDYRRVRASQSTREGTALTDGMFMASRDRQRFTIWPESFLRPGLRLARNWFYGDNYQCLGLLETKSAIEDAPHELSFFASEAALQGESMRWRRYTLRMDGFVSLAAPLAGGELITRPLIFTGEELELNYSTSVAGGLRVEIQDGAGQPVAGFSLADAEELYGDSLDQRALWKPGSKLGQLSGKPVRLRFALKDADLFSFRFRSAGTNAGTTAAPLRKILSIAWKKGPDLPQGFQDSDGGIVNHRLITVGGFCSGQANVPGKPAKYPRGFLKRVWGLDLRAPQTGWQSLPELPGVERQELFAITVADQLYCWGGFSYATPFCYADGYRLSHGDGQWSWDPLPPLPSPACSAGIAAIDAKIFVMGGGDYDENRFYTASDRKGDHKGLGARLLMLDTKDLAAGWKELPPCPGTPRMVHATAGVKGKLYVIGGGTGNDNPSGHYCTVVDNWCFDPTTTQWQRLPDTPIATGNFPAGAITYQDRYIVLVGGYQYQKVLDPTGSVRPPYGEVTKHYPKNDYNSDMLVFDTVTATFGVADPLPLCNNLPMAVLAGDELHLIGGETGGSEIEGEPFGHHPDLYLVGKVQLVTSSPRAERSP